MLAQARRTALPSIAALLASAGAPAASFNWGVHGAGEAGVSFVSPGSFYDTWRFSIADVLVLDSSVAVSNNLPPSLSIAGGHYTLFGFGADNVIGNGDDLNFGPSLGWSFDGTTGSVQNLVSLTAGNYYFAVEGLANGTAGGLYTITSTISPVPEPQAYAMLLAGLGLLGLWGRRRRRIPARGGLPA
jgi:hypothetical protein